MAIKNQLAALASKEMDRKDFLKYSGGVVLGVIGVTGLVRVLVGQKDIAFTEEPALPKVQKQAGYGASIYGR